MIPRFEDIYENQLVSAVSQFKIVRQRLHFFIISTLSGIVILAIAAFRVLEFLEYKNEGNTLILWWFLIFLFTAVFLVIDARKVKMDHYTKNIGFIYAFLNFYAFILFNSYNGEEHYDNSLLVALSMIAVSIGLMLFISSSVLENYANQYREIVIDEMIKHMGINMRYKPQGKIGVQEFANSDIRKVYPRDYNGCDLIELEHQTQSFKFSNIRINRIRELSDKDEFISVFLIADIQQKLKGTTKIANRDSGMVGGFIEDMISMDKNLTQLNYPQLKKYFKVSATRPHEAEKLLTSAFVERLLKFSKKINLPSSPNTPMLFRLHLKENKLYTSFMFNGDDGRLFPLPSPTEPTDYENTLRIGYNRLKTVLEFVEQVHLTNNEWEIGLPV